ncbi:hypothetical protein X977_5722 [Burkholderia pseudomallei MSHR7504]|nr:hypothetical protein X977_5722 [Burkholderia pseudomallei MSHR7504]
MRAGDHRAGRPSRGNSGEKNKAWQLVIVTNSTSSFGQCLGPARGFLRIRSANPERGDAEPAGRRSARMILCPFRPAASASTCPNTTPTPVTI